MDKLTIVLGNKNYSTWSLRPWLALVHTGRAFDEIVIPLYRPESKEQILAHSPNGKVPALLHGPIVVWESLAICEYLADTFPDARLWPEDRAARAHARSVSTEMHGGFPALRTHLPMSLREDRKQSWFPADARKDAERVLAIWEDCRSKYAAGGPFLFGRFSIADAMYAPVVERFRIYGYPLQGAAREYAATMLALPSMQRWEDEARKETIGIPAFD